MARWFRILLAGIACLVVVLPVAALAFFHLPAGERLIEQELRAFSEGRVRLTDLDVHNFLDVRIGNFSIGPVEGTEDREVEVRGLTINWSPWRLLEREAHVAEMVAEYVFVSPSDNQGEGPEPGVEGDVLFSLPSLPALPVAVVVEKIDVATLVFAAPQLGLEGHYNLAGQAKMSRTLGHVEADVALARVDRDGKLALNIRYGAPVGEIRVDLKFHDEDGAPLAALTGYDGGALSIDVQAHGPLHQTKLFATGRLGAGPSMQAALNVGYDEKLTLNGDVSFVPNGLGGAELSQYLGAEIPLGVDVAIDTDGKLQLALDTRIQGTKLDANMSLSAAGSLAQTLQWTLDVRNLDAAEIPAGLGALQLSVKGHLDQLTNLVVVENAILTGQGVRTKLTGAVPLSSPMAARLDATVNVDNVSVLVPGQAGSAQASVALRGAAASQTIAITGDGRAKLFLAEDQPLDVGINLAGSFSADLIAEMNGKITVPHLVQINPALSGSLFVDGQLSGAWEALKAEVRLSSASFAMEMTPLESVSAHMSVQQLAGGLAGRIDLRALAASQKLIVSTPFEFSGGTVSLDALSLSGPGLGAQGRVRYDTESSIGEGAVKAQFEDLAPLAELFGQKIIGSGSLSATLAGDRAMLNAAFNKLGGASVGGELGTLTVDISTLLSDPVSHATGNVMIEQIALGGVVSPQTLLAVVPSNKGIGFKVTTSTTAPILMELQTQGEIELGTGIKLHLDSLEGEIEGERVVLSNPTTFSMNDKGGLSLQETDIVFGGGTASVKFLQTQKAVDGTLTFAGIDLSRQVPAGGPLVVDGGVRVLGAPTAPDISFNVASEIEIADLDENVQIRLEGDVLNGALKSEIRVGGAGGNLRASATGWVDANLADGVFGVRQGRPLQVQTRGDLELAPFAFFLFDDGSTLAGRLTLTSDGAFKHDEVALQGSLCLADLSVGFVASGTQIREGRGCVTLDQAGGLAGKVQAVDGHGGAFAVTFSAGAGTVSFNGQPGQMPPKILSDIVVSQMRVLDGDIGVMTLDGTLAAQARLDEALTGHLKGALTVTKADIAIPGNPGPSFETLDVTHTGRAIDQSEPPIVQADDPVFGSGLGLDILIDVPKQFFVRGRGIESEWRGKVGVKGSAVAPIISGDISMVKGQATTGAAVLEFSKGKVTMVPDPPATLPIMLLDMVSESRVDGTLVRMSLFGPVTKPEIGFSSEPALPEDEILARLLFGKPAAQMTASEALSLASAALELTGAFGGGVGVVGRVRQALGVDRLSVDSSSVSAGKYITPDVYLSVKQSADGSAPDIAVEYEVTDEITLTGEQEGANGEAVGIRYEYDY